MLSIKNPKIENEKTLLDKKAVPDVINSLIKSKIEACSGFNDSSCNSYFHPLMNAAHDSFSDHIPFTLSPDILWLAIAQGFSQHINMNAEKYRFRFVDHEGKKDIHVIRNEFKKGNPNNNWQGVFPEFTNQIKKYIGEEKYTLIVDAFSTTGPTETAAYEVTLMDSVQSYFSLHCHTMCGIPEIFIEGTKKDYQKILTKLDQIGSFDLDWWTNRLKGIVEQIVNTFDGLTDAKFWDSIYKLNGGSGGPFIDGWLASFMPYIKNYDKKFIQNPLLVTQSRSRLTTESFTSGMSQTPFVWHYMGSDFDYEFIAGFTGFTQDITTFSLKPTIGWAVTEKKK